MRKLVSVTACFWAFAGPSLVAALADDVAIEQAIGRYQDAFNQQDVSMIESLWHETAVWEDTSSNSELLGRDAIIGQLKEVFAEENPPTLTISLDSVAVQDGGAFLVSGTNSLASSDSTESFAFTALLQSMDGKWKITRVTESSSVERSSESPLKSIDWLIGVWSAVNDDDAVVNEFRYMPGNRFIVRTFAAKDDSSRQNRSMSKSLGYQIIGTLPGESQLRSWTFLGDGTVLQANWIVEEQRILVESKGRLADGSEATGTYVFKLVDQDTVTMKVVGHSIDGEPVPSNGTVTLNRQPNGQEPKE